MLKNAMVVLFTGSYYGGVSVTDNPSLIPSESVPAGAALAIIEYKGSDSSTTPMSPNFPKSMDSTPAMDYIARLKGFDPYDLAETPDHELVYVVGIASVACTVNETTCTQKLAGTVQNITFDDPQVRFVDIE